MITEKGYAGKIRKRGLQGTGEKKKVLRPLYPEPWVFYGRLGEEGIAQHRERCRSRFHLLEQQLTGGLKLRRTKTIKVLTLKQDW